MKHPFCLAATLVLAAQATLAQPATRPEIRAVNPTPHLAAPKIAPTWRADSDHPIRLPPIKQSEIMPMPMREPRPPAPRVLPIKDTVQLVDIAAGTVTELPLSHPKDDPTNELSHQVWEGVGPIDNSDQGGANWSATMAAVSDASLSAYPARANVRLVMRFVDSGGNDRFFVCSGTMMDSGIVLTAGHCVYDHEPGGFTVNDYAQEIWVYPAWDGVGNSVPDDASIIQNFGYAKADGYIVGSAYVENEDHDRDVAALRLGRDSTRSVGMLTGWFGTLLNGCDTDLIFANYSYPAENCGGGLHTGRQMYFWQSTPNHCPGLISNQYDLNTDGGCLGAVWGGMSGSSMYRFFNGVRSAAAVSSTSNRNSDANYCALWDQFVTDLYNMRDGVRGNTFDIEALQFRAGSGTPAIDQGDQVPAGSVMIANATNNNPASRDITLHVYLSSNTNISTSDTLLDTFLYTDVNFSAMDVIQFNVPASTIPYGTPPGNYYVGIIIDGTEDTNSNNNDTDTWDAQAISVWACNLPIYPLNVQASDGVYCDKIRVTWSAAPAATSYEVYRSTTNNPNSAPLLNVVASTSFDDISATPSVFYYYWIKSRNGCGTGAFFSFYAQGFRDQPPGTPQNVIATNGTTCLGTNITWVAADNRADDFLIYRNTVNNSGSAAHIGTDSASPFTDYTGTAGVAYYYWVRASNNCGNSAYSVPNTGFRDPNPQAVVNVAASDGTDCYAVRIDWSGYGLADSYIIYRSTINNSAFASQIGTTDAPDDTTYFDFTAAVGQTYFYWVRAVNDCGSSPFSTSNAGWRNAFPTAPANVQASDSASCATNITVTWNPVPAASSFSVWRNTINSTPGASHLGDTAATNYVDNTAAIGTTYYYWVKGVSNCFTSTFSTPDTGTRGNLPSPATNVQASDGTTCRSVSISWTGGQGASVFDIYRNTINNSGSASLIGSDNASPFTDSNVVGLSTYYYWVRARNACGAAAFAGPNSGYAGLVLSITDQPDDLIVAEGGVAIFTVDAAGANAYQWRKNGVDLLNGGNINGVYNNTLIIDPATEADEGAYDCFVSSTCGREFTNAAMLTVNPPVSCPADFNQDGGIDGADIDSFFQAWEQGESSADVNADGGIDGGDVEFFFEKWEAGGC